MPDTIAFFLDQPMLGLAICSMLLVLMGGVFRRAIPWLGRLLRGIGNLGLVAALLLTVIQVARLSGGGDFALPGFGLPSQQVSGQESRIRMAEDGHFWITATVNGVPARFMVDTGATLTALSDDVARQANIRENSLRQPVLLRTANGTVTAPVVSINEFALGNIVARQLDAVIAPGMGDFNVIGMNFLSRLKSWRVEGRTLVLVPNHPQPRQ